MNILPTEIIVYIGEISMSDMLKNMLLLSALCKRLHVIWDERIWKHLFVKKCQIYNSLGFHQKFFTTSSWKNNYTIMNNSEYYLENFTSTRKRELISYYNEHYQVPLCGDVVKIEQEESSDYIFMLVSVVSKDKTRKDTSSPHKLFFGGLQVIEGTQDNTGPKFYIKRKNLVLTTNYMRYKLYGRKSSPNYFICNQELIY